MCFGDCNHSRHFLGGLLQYRNDVDPAAESAETAAILFPALPSIARRECDRSVTLILMILDISRLEIVNAEISNLICTKLLSYEVVSL